VRVSQHILIMQLQKQFLKHSGTVEVLYVWRDLLKLNLILHRSRQLGLKSSCAIHIKTKTCCFVITIFIVFLIYGHLKVVFWLHFTASSFTLWMIQSQTRKKSFIHTDSYCFVYCVGIWVFGDQHDQHILYTSFKKTCPSVEFCCIVYLVVDVLPQL